MLKYVITTFFAVALSVAAHAECASGYTQITVPLCAPITGGVTAIPANTFLNSLGADIHISQGYPESTYETEFTYTGIRNARDYYVSSSYVTLHNNTVSSTYPGVKMDILADAVSTIVLQDGIPGATSERNRLRQHSSEEAAR